MNKILTIAALALVLSACSNEDNDIQTPVEQPAKSEGIPFTATISMGESASTRALTEDTENKKIVATWATGEKVALIYDAGGTPTKTDAEVTKQADGTATISATLASGATNGSAVTIIYPSDAADGTTGNVKSDWLSSQDGTLTGTGGTSIAEKYDVRKGTGKLSINDGKATVNNGTAGTTVSLTNQNAIFKLTLKDIDGTNDVSATSVVISDQTGVVTTVTPASGYENAMYVALPTTATTLKFLVTGSDSKKYFNMASSLSLGASYYQSTVKLATVGDVILSTGKCAKAGTGSPVAMIAYLGNGADCTNGLAIELNSSPVKKVWYGDVAKNYAAGLTAVPGGTWRLPSMGDWQKMFLACAKSGDASGNDASGYWRPIAGFKEKIDATGIGWNSTWYWTSDNATYSRACYVDVVLNRDPTNARFGASDIEFDYSVLGCLAF